jgi:hypothetical protein
VFPRRSRIKPVSVSARTGRPQRAVRNPGQDRYLKNKPIVSLFFLALAGLSLAGEKIDFRSLTNGEIEREFVSASKIDGHPGISEQELKMKFGKSDAVTDESQWRGGKKHVYKLSGNRKMAIDRLNGRLMLAVIENDDGDKYLLWK